MYLEISGRQCGKTTRLIDFAIKRARKGERILISTPFLSSIKRIKDVIREKTKNDKLVNPKQDVFRRFVETLSLIHVVHKCVDVAICFRQYDWICYDEFDFNPFIRLENIGKNTYFVTSPKFLRKVEDRKKSNKCDILYQLILKKKGKYHSYINPVFHRQFNSQSPSTYWQERFGVWKLDENGYVTLNREVKPVWLK